MQKFRISKKSIDALQPTLAEYTVWDSELPGFGVRVRPSGAMSYILCYRAGRGRRSPTRRLTLGSVGAILPDEARQLARKRLGSVAHGSDPAAEERAARTAITVSELGQVFLARHVSIRRKRQTLESYRHIIDAYIVPAFGNIAAKDLTRSEAQSLHERLGRRPSAANRVIAVLSSIYTFAYRQQLISSDHNPAKGVEKYREIKRERYLSSTELARLGAALREGETTGIIWHPKKPDAKLKHLPALENRKILIDQYSAAAIRLLLFTGARKSEILNLRWRELDLERGLFLLPDSKTGQKTLYLNPATLQVLASLPRIGEYVIAGSKIGAARCDLKRPWKAIVTRAGLDNIRLHDLRHTHASFGVTAGLGLPIIGKLLGHSQPMTTARYAHLGDDPTKLASLQISGAIATALNADDTEGFGA
ncbi:site-specific integrase [Tardiphaga robiniae]|uniref:site-specific integrase n=1 Tax=Tardiphaga robiniae TaxID=943830 RepID=UPI0009D67F92|nr:site-specific integrase [Tardiphaga robiniae]